MVHHAQMTQFMHHHIVDHCLLEMNQPPVQANRSVGVGAAPAGTGAGQAELSPVNVQMGGEMGEALGKQPFGLPHQPGLDRVSNLIRASGVTQANVQRELGHAR